eukprot:26911_1
MALSDEDFNIEDEEDYETSDSDIDTKPTLDSDDSDESTQSEIGSDETTQSESGLYDQNSDSDDTSTDSQSNRNKSNTNTDSDEKPQLNEAEQQRQIKQKQMGQAQKDLQNIHKKLRQIIEDKLRQKKKYKNTSKKYRNKATQADDEYLACCFADMNEEEGIIDVLSEQPSLINMEKGVLRNYQLDGLNWLIRVQETGLAAILADEMGLGKTLQCIALLAYNKQYKSISGPTLIVVPKSTLYNWQKEFNSWCPSLRIFLLDGEKAERKALIDEYILSVLDERNLDFDVAITSYEQCNIESHHLQRITWFYIVVDEAHRMKNEKAVLSQTIRSFKSAHRLLITGTPLQNNLHELWALLNFLIPEAFADAQSFDVLFEAQQQHTNNTNSQVLDDELLSLINNMLREMHKLLRPLMLRRLKYDVEKSLPPKTEMILYVGMSTIQIALYKSLLSRNMSVLRNTISSKKALLNTAMQLRKVCNHPYLFDGVEDRSLPVHGTHVIDNSAKLCMLNKLLPKLLEQGSKCLIFCQMTRMLDILDDYCYIKGYKRCRIDGNTLGHDRQSQMDDFNAPGSNKFVFLLSTRAGGLGINLVAADCVIFYDSDWNPQMDLQAQDRAHRIGQTKAVKIFRLVSKNTIEEKILQRAQLKLNLDEMVIQHAAKTSAAAANKQAVTVSSGEVAAMIKHGIASIMKTCDGDAALKQMNERSIEEILSQGAAASSALNELMAKHARNKFSIKCTDYSLLEDCALDENVFRTLAKIHAHQEDNRKAKKKKKKGGRTTNNSSNLCSNIKIENLCRAINKAQKVQQKVNDLEPPQKAPSMQYFHFFEAETLGALFDKQWNWYNKYKNVVRDEIPQLECARYGLSEEEYALKEKLFAAGFADWNHKHMWAFVKACAEYGRQNIDQICKVMYMKSREEIIRYSQCFFANKRNEKEIIKKIGDISDGERTLERYSKYDLLLKKKVKKYEYPMQEMQFRNAPYDARAHGWRIQHDRFIVCKAKEIGYGRWNELRLAILNSKQFKFDYFIKSRTNNDINKRMRQLRPCIEKEFGQHIRIFDRRPNAKELQKRKEKEQKRLRNHLKDLSKALKREKQMKREREDDLPQPPTKKRKMEHQELPTPPPVAPMVYTEQTVYPQITDVRNMPYYPPQQYPQQATYPMPYQT